MPNRRLALAALGVAFISACSAAPGPTGGTGPGSETDPTGGGDDSTESDAGSSQTGHDAGAALDSGSAVKTPPPDSGSPKSTGPQDSGAPDTGSKSSAPTWSQIFTLYLSGTTSGSGGTVGHCGACHGQVTSASTAYSFLQSTGYLASLSKTPIFSWMGGTMPPGGATSDTKAASDIEAWIAAGASDN